jgi:hypothetical protein
MKDINYSYVLWKPAGDSSLLPTQEKSFTQLAEFVIVTTAQPISNKFQVEKILGSPPTLDMMTKILSKCPLTSEHFKLSVPILGTFAIWVLSQEGNHYLVIPRGYGGPDGNVTVSQYTESHCLNLVTNLAQLILKRPIPSESLLWCAINATQENYTVFTIGIPVRCDICGHPVESLSSFSLSAKQIVSTPYYWQVRYQNNKVQWAQNGIYSFKQYRSDKGVRESEVRLILNLGSDWLVCDTCIAHFVVDCDQAQQFAAEWWKNRTSKSHDDWAATPSDVNMG